jgi:release factor glutamine methyltransferase
VNKKGFNLLSFIKFSNAYLYFASINQIRLMNIKIHDNSLLSVRNYFNEKLQDIYPEGELNSLFFIGLDYYLNVRRLDFFANPYALVSESDILRIRTLAKELKKEKPIQYILGETTFMDLRMKVNENVLIPRPETEEMVDDIIKKNQDFKSIIDLCSGSGCIALALKNGFPKAKVVGVELSDKAIEIAKENAALNKLADSFIKGDVLHLKTDISNIDLIVSNPPYVRRIEKLEMKKNVLDYEPHLALFVEDEDPLLFYRAIISLAVEKLNSGGALYMEINEKFGEEVMRLMKHAGIEQNLRMNKDLNGKDRWLSGQIK